MSNFHYCFSYSITLLLAKFFIIHYQQLSSDDLRTWVTLNS